MSIHDLEKKDDAALRTQVKALRKESFNLRFQKANGQLTNTARIPTVRREIARVKTVLSQRARSLK